MNGSWTLLTQSATWHVCFSDFQILKIDIVHGVGIKPKAANVQFTLQTAGTDTNHIKDDSQVPLSNTNTTESTEKRFEKHQQALVQVFEDNDSLTKGAANTIADF